MIIRSANSTDLDAIRHLWQDCFFDPIEYIDFYIKNRFEAKYCAVLEIDGEVVGMIHLLPCTIYPEEKALYWYAAGIRSDKRNQGLFKKFAKAVKEKANELGFYNVCVPAPGLESYYQSLGFEFPYMSSDVVIEKSDENSKITFEDGEARDFSCADFANFGNTIWSENAIQYAIDENKYCGGKVLRFKMDEKFYCFFAIKKENEFLIEYHNMTIEEFKKVKNAICSVLNCETLIFRTNGKEKIVGLTDANAINSRSKITMTLA